jgi:hypothetical protein
LRERLTRAFGDAARRHEPGAHTHDHAALISGQEASHA